MLVPAVAAGIATVIAWMASPVPVAAALVAPGLVVAAAVDAKEGRVPTALAHGTTAVSFVALVVTAWDRDEWGDVVVRALVGTALLVAVVALLWLIGWVGFGDVRLAAATMTAMVHGSGGPLVVFWVAIVVTGVVALFRRGRGKTPFGPGLVAGWLAAVVVSLRG